DPLWMLGHVIRGLGLGALAFYLWRYQSTIKNWRGTKGEGSEQFIRNHSAAWTTGALVLGVLLAYGLIYVSLSVPGAHRFDSRLSFRFGALMCSIRNQRVFIMDESP